MGAFDGQAFTLASARGGAAKSSTEREPDLVLTSPAHVLVAARRGDRTLADAIREGTVSFEGKKRALRNFQRIFALV